MLQLAIQLAITLFAQLVGDGDALIDLWELSLLPLFRDPADRWFPDFLLTIDPGGGGQLTLDGGAGAIPPLWGYLYFYLCLAVILSIAWFLSLTYALSFCVSVHSPASQALMRPGLPARGRSVSVPGLKDGTRVSTSRGCYSPLSLPLSESDSRKAYVSMSRNSLTSIRTVRHNGTMTTGFAMVNAACMTDDYYPAVLKTVESEIDLRSTGAGANGTTCVNGRKASTVDVLTHDDTPAKQGELHGTGCGDRKVPSVPVAIQADAATPAEQEELHGTGCGDRKVPSVPVAIQADAATPAEQEELHGTGCGVRKVPSVPVAISADAAKGLGSDSGDSVADGGNASPEPESSQLCETRPSTAKKHRRKAKGTSNGDPLNVVSTESPDLEVTLSTASVEDSALPTSSEVKEPTEQVRKKPRHRAGWARKLANDKRKAEEQKKAECG